MKLQLVSTSYRDSSTLSFSTQSPDINTSAAVVRDPNGVLGIVSVALVCSP